MKHQQRHKSSDRPSPYAPQSYTVEGLAATAEYLRFRPKAVEEIRCEARLRPKVEQLLISNGVQVPIHERRRPSSDADRGDIAPVVAKVSLKALPQAEFLTRLDTNAEQDLIVAVDHLTDPRNLGAIVRTAAYFGIRAVIAPERRQVLLTQSAVATAQGGFALTDLVCVVNLSRCLEKLKELGYWIIGTAMDGEEFRHVAGIYRKAVLVLGNEELGLSQSVRSGCDRTIAIKGRTAGLDSLNVAVAAGICIESFTHANDTHLQRKSVDKPKTP